MRIEGLKEASTCWDAAKQRGVTSARTADLTRHVGVLWAIRCGGGSTGKGRWIRTQDAAVAASTFLQVSCKGAGKGPSALFVGVAELRVAGHRFEQTDCAVESYHVTVGFAAGMAVCECVVIVRT